MTGHGKSKNFTTTLSLKLEEEGRNSGNCSSGKKLEQSKANTPSTRQGEAEKGEKRFTLEAKKGIRLRRAKSLSEIPIKIFWSQAPKPLLSP